MFLSVIIFYAQCWARDWLLYPNWNYPSWSYAFACFTCVGHCIAAIFLYWVSTNHTHRCLNFFLVLHITKIYLGQNFSNCDVYILYIKDAVKAKERKAKNKALLMQMHPQASLGFSSIGHGRQLYAGGSYATGGGSHGATGGSGYI